MSNRDLLRPNDYDGIIVITSTKAKATSKISTEQVSEQAVEKPQSFEQAFSELESIVAQMESGQMALDASLAAYQHGNALLQFCQKALTEVEQQVQILNERNQLVKLNSQDDE